MSSCTSTQQFRCSLLLKEAIAASKPSSTLREIAGDYEDIEALSHLAKVSKLRMTVPAALLSPTLSTVLVWRPNSSSRRVSSSFVGHNKIWVFLCLAAIAMFPPASFIQRTNWVDSRVGSHLHIVDGKVHDARPKFESTKDPRLCVCWCWLNVEAKEVATTTIVLCTTAKKVFELFRTIFLILDRLFESLFLSQGYELSLLALF